MDNIDFGFNKADVGDEVSRRVAAHAPMPELQQGAPVVQSKQAPAVSPFQAPVHKHRSGIWSVKPDMVPELPELHPLERTAVFVPDEEPAAISERISGELRDRSIEAYFDEDYAKAKCTTPDGVEFRVRLYRGRGKFAHGVIVEVQRRFGVSTHFHTDTMAILDRAKGKEVPRVFKSKNLPLVSDTEDSYKPNGSSSLSMVSKMLKQGGYDSQYLGLQTLRSLTDANKMGTSTASAISKELFRPGNEVGGKVLHLILESKAEDETFKLRTVSMVILANALHAVKGDIPSDVREQLEPALLEDLRSAERNLRVAFQAARSVEMLLQVEKQNVTEYDEALKIAREVGQARHAALQKQTDKCLKKMMA